MIFLFSFFRAFLVCKLYRFCHMKEEDFHPNVQFHQETNGAAENQLRDFNTDPGANSTVDQSDGGSHSSESTMTTSVPDSDAVSSTMAIDQPEQIVASQAESGQPGGASCLPSRKTLPLICTQLGADLVHEQYDSRTSDNKDKEDMDDKVHKINRGQ